MSPIGAPGAISPSVGIGGGGLYPGGGAKPGISSAGSRLVNLVDEGAVGNDPLRDSLAWNAAVTKALAKKCGIEVPAGATYQLTNPGVQFLLDLPASVPLVVHPGAIIEVQAGVTLTIASSIKAGDYGIFSGAGAVVLSRDQWANVRWFGATGDGDAATGAGTDDSPAVAKAAAASLRLLFPESEGAYLFAGVALRSGARVRFAEGATAGLPAAIVAGPAYCFTAAGNAGAHANGPKVRGCVADGRGLLTAILSASYCDDPQLIECGGANFSPLNTNQGSVGSFVNCTRPKAVRCFVDGATYGVTFTTCSNPKDDRGEYRNVQRDGVLFYNLCTNASAIGTEVDTFALGGDDGRAGIHFYGGENGRAVGCQVRNDAHTSESFRARDFARAKFIGCDASDGYNGFGFVTLGDFPGYIASGLVSGCTVSGMNPGGLNSNIVSDANSGRVVVIGNETFGGRNGVMLNSPGGVIVGNTFEDSNAAPISANGARTLISGNKVRRNAAFFGGVSFAIGVNAPDVQVLGNDVEDQRPVASFVTGVNITDGASATLRDNTFTDNIGAYYATTGTGKIKRGSLVRGKFAGLQAGLNCENGVEFIDTNGRRSVFNGAIGKQIGASLGAALQHAVQQFGTSAAPVAGAVAVDASLGTLVRVVANGNVVIGNPANAADGAVLMLDVTNASAGAIAVTLGTFFTGVFAAPAAGKRRTQSYAFSLAETKWVAQGAQSADM